MAKIFELGAKKIGPAPKNERGVILNFSYRYKYRYVAWPLGVAVCSRPLGKSRLRQDKEGTVPVVPYGTVGPTVGYTV
jgi:hypothetical protein